MEVEAKSQRLLGRRIALGITGSIAAIEAPKIARELLRHGATVRAYMTPEARRIIHPNAMEFATQEDVVTRLTGRLEHLEEFDLVLVAPATATTISKIVNGIADTPVTALALSTKARVVIAPAMHDSMYENPIFKENMERLKALGYRLVDPRFEESRAKLAGLGEIVDACIAELTERELEGKRVLVTAGPTIEYLDPVRILTNKSSGKMGIEVAKEAYFRGAKVRLVYGFGTEVPPSYLDVVKVETAEEMLRAVELEIARCDIFVAAAAVADFSPQAAKEKIESRSGGFELKLTPTPKILANVIGSKAFKVGFKALHDVSEDILVKKARELIEEHRLSLVVANDVAKGVFRSESDEVYLVDRTGVTHVPRAPKAEVARQMWDRIVEMMR